MQNADSEYLLRIAGNLTDEAVKTISDDGVSQQVTLKKGAATLGNEIKKNRVKLTPYRTFLEVEQPSSEFVFRIAEGPVLGLFEADGGAWKLEAMKRIESYLKSNIHLPTNTMNSTKTGNGITILR